MGGACWPDEDRTLLLVIGVWDHWNASTKPEPYGLSDTYSLGAEWLRQCSLIEDWGCGRGYLRTFIEPERYRGIDGSGPHADVIADLAEYRSRTSGLFMRHVLEHNYRWSDILANAVASFSERMFLVIFTPLVAETVEIKFAPDPGVPDFAFYPGDLEQHFAGVGWTRETMQSPTEYGTETVYRLERE